MESKRKSSRRTPPPKAQEAVEVTNKIILEAADSLEPPAQEEFIDKVTDFLEEQGFIEAVNSGIESEPKLSLEPVEETQPVQVPEVAWANSSQTLIRIGDRVINTAQIACIDLGATEVVIHFTGPTPISDVKPHRDRHNNLVSWEWEFKGEIAQKLKQLLSSNKVIF